MSAEPDLFTGYPIAAGYKAEGTSREAAETTDAAGIRAKALEALKRHGALTADECAERLRMDRLSIRPRFSELKLDGKVQDTGKRRQNASKKSAIVWSLAA